MGKRDDERLEVLAREIRTLSQQVASLKGEKDYLNKASSLAEEIVRLKEDVENLTIQKARLREEQDKREREILHKVGLEQKRQEFEAEQALKGVETARREAILEVKEANLDKERDAFEKEMKFITERFSKENDYVRKIMESILERLPDVSVALNGGRDKEE